MTTAVYVRGRYLAADTKSCGGHTGINNDVEKIFSIYYGNEELFLVFAGIKMLSGLVEGLARKHFIQKNSDENSPNYHQALYNFKDEIKVHAGDRFEGILVDKKSGNAYKINETSVEDVRTSCTIGSGGDIAMGILLRDPEIPLEELYKLVSSKDTYTGEKFISIDLTK